jgi:hypothetical protein
MASIYRQEALIRADRITATVNLAILRTEAARKRRDVTPQQTTAAILVAVLLERIVRDHGMKRIT